MTIDALRRIVGDAHLVAGADVEPRYLADETGGTAGRPLALVRPADSAQLSAILALCNAAGQSVVTQGGRTGMARGALPRDGELILSLERLRAIEAIDPAAGTMIVQAGVVLQTAQTAAADAGWQLAVDIGARGSCTIGGMIATNAGGTQVMRHGMMREQVLGLEVVLADGTLLTSMNAMLKNNAGYDLKQLFIGSEGTLGIVTRAVLRLRPPPAGRQSALCAVADYAAAVALLNRLQRRLPGQVTAFELMWRDFFEAACAIVARRQDGPAPFAAPHPLVVLVEVESAQPDDLAAALMPAIEEGAVADAVSAQSERDRLRLWALRDAIGEIMAAMTVAEPFDVSAPIGAIGALVDRLRPELLRSIKGCRPYFFGHIADGNLHLAVDLPQEADRRRAETIVYDAVRDVGGSISAEHGIGMLKRAWLAHSRTPEEIVLMRMLRSTLDPRAILNPQRIL